MKQLKTLTRSFVSLVLGLASGIILYLSATNLVNMLLEQGNFTEHSFIVKYFSISNYFYNEFPRNFAISYLICLIYYAAYWVFKFLDFRLSKKPVFKDFSWNMRKFFVNLIIPALVLGIMLSIREEDSVKFLFPVTLLLAVNNTRMLFRAQSASKKPTQKASSEVRRPPRRLGASSARKRKSSRKNKPSSVF